MRISETPAGAVGLVIRASDTGASLTIAASLPITAAATSRSLGGVVVRYGEAGRTSAGRLKVAPGALLFPDDLGTVKLTREHERDNARGHLTAVHDNGQELRIAARVSDGPEGDAALREAQDRTRDGLSFDVVDAQIHGDTIVSARVIAIGQVGIPAYDNGRIDTIAASQQKGSTMTEEQRARLAELRAKSTLSDSEQTELEQLAQLESAEAQAPDESGSSDNQGQEGATASSGAGSGQSVAASQSRVPAVPTGGPSSGGATTRPRPGEALRRFVQSLHTGLAPGGNVMAALSDVTNTGVDGGILSAPAWSGELWSGVQHEREFVPMLNHGDLTNWEGKGWRWVTKPVMGDYAGDKAAIPSGAIDTEPSSYTAARLAVGHDLDRKFYDFPDQAFLESYLSAVGESYSVKTDAKALAYIVANAVEQTGPDGADAGTDPDPIVKDTVLKAAAYGARRVKRLTRAKATFVICSDNDFDTLMDVSADDVPAFLTLFDIDPSSFTNSDQVDDGTVIVGTKQAATFRELGGGSPIRVSAQHIANGGVDEGFFGYWAVEQHHPSGIVSVGYAAV